MSNVLGQRAIEAFEARGISGETAGRFAIYTGRRVRNGDKTDVVPDADGNIIVFPFLDRGAVVAEKYRQLPWAPRKTWQREGGKRTFLNADILDDPALAEGRYPLIIVEGEPDFLTAIDCGFPFTVSVPDGAPPVPKGREPEDLDPIDFAGEATGKFEFIWNNRDRLKAVKRFVIAVDDDLPGKRLAAELVRRLSASRCLFVTYPEGCKDLNEVRVRHGAEAVAKILNGAQPYPVSGLYRLREFPPAREIATCRTGWATLDAHLKPFLGELMFVLGIPGHGKSAFATNLVVNLCERYGWRAAIFGPEEPTVPLCATSCAASICAGIRASRDRRRWHGPMPGSTTGSCSSRLTHAVDPRRRPTSIGFSTGRRTRCCATASASWCSIRGTRSSSRGARAKARPSTPAARCACSTASATPTA
jgi:twinkle protein